MIAARAYFRGTVFALCLAVACPSLAQDAVTNAAPASTAVSAQTADTVAGMVQDGYHHLDNGELDDALREVDAALQLDPHNAAAYELRGAIHIQKKLWDRAEDDYNAALSIAPDTVAYKYKLAEIKFLQKAYDDARPRYALIANDPNLGDLAAYKVFLCDLFSGHDARAASELAVFNQAGINPSYYFANAAWSLMHNKMQEANTWANSAQEIFDPSRLELYRSPLLSLNDLHLPVVTFTTKSGDSYNQVKAFVEDKGLRVNTPKGWITIPYEQLPDDLTLFPADVRNKIIAKREAVSNADGGASTVSFTTKAGREYDSVRVSVKSGGLQVLTADGWVTLPFDQLPDDLSPFPADMRERIVVKRQTAMEEGKGTSLPSFTTKDGKKYDQVRVTAADDGLEVLTADGWISIPYQQLPDDLSAFAPDLREQIKGKRQKVSTADDGTSTVSFTTKPGRSYDQVRVALISAGLQILTADGWITIPFDQLPNDLSAFPADLRDRIVAKRQAATASAKETSLLSFTTKQGKVYDQVRVFAADDGLQVLTADGWISVPYLQLPDNLSPFPADLREQILAKRQNAAEAGGGDNTVSFTTRNGKLYDQLRALVADDGLQVLTSDGWVTIPFAQLPEDLSSFPAALREQIAAKQKASSAKGTAALNLNGAQPEPHPQ